MTRLPNLDPLRLLLALTVIVGHTYGTATGNRFVWPVEPVSVFLAVSGLVILPSVQRWSPYVFFVRRAARVMPAFVLSIILCLGLNGPEAVKNALWAWVSFGIPRIPSGNGVLWSLSTEEVMYGSCVLLALAGAYRPRYVVPLLWLASTAVAVLCDHAGGSILRVAMVVPCFFIGNLFYRYRETVTRVSAWWFAGLLALTFVVSWKLPALMELAHVPALQSLVQVAWVQLGAVSLVGLAITMRPVKMPKWLPEMSYGLYIFHVPLLTCLGTLSWLPVLLVLPVAWASRVWLEEPFIRWAQEWSAKELVRDRLVATVTQVDPANVPVLVKPYNVQGSL